MDMNILYKYIAQLLELQYMYSTVRMFKKFSYIT